MKIIAGNGILILLLLLVLPTCGSAEVSDTPQAEEPAAVSDTALVRAAVADVRAGLAHAAERRTTDAVAAYAAAAQRVPTFRDWAAVLSASAAARAGDTAAVRAQLARADSTLARNWGWRARVNALVALGDTVGAARLAARIAEQLSDSARQAEAWTRAGMLHHAARRNADAIAAFRRAIDSSIGSVTAIDAARTLSEIGTPAAEDQLRIGRVFLRHSNATRAATAFDAYFARGNPTAAQRASIELDLGRAFFNARQYPAAERRLRAAITAPGNTGAEALYLLGRSQYRRGATAEARATFLRVTRSHAGTAAAARAHFTIADIEHDADRIESARTHYRAVLEGTYVSDAPLAALRLGSLALNEGRARDAARLFAGRFQRSGAGVAERQQMGFWWAQSLQRAGAADSAKLVYRDVLRLDPFSYYGMRAGEILEESAQVAPGPTIDAAVRARVAGSVDVVDILREAGLTDEASYEASRLTARHADALYALGLEYHARGQTARGVSLGRELQRGEGRWNRQLLQLVYPFPFREDIVREARAHNLDPYLVAGLIRQESMFNPRARSVAGALGLMQVMPETGTRVARGMNMRSFSTAQLTTPDVNLRIGTRYLADQIRGHNNRIIDAVAAYNAGPHRVARWSAFPEYRDDDLFIERIPYQETRDYVKIVQQNARIYRMLYGDAM